MSPALLVACSLATAAALALPTIPTPLLSSPVSSPPGDDGWLRRWRPAWSVLAGMAVLTFLTAPLRWPVAALAVVVAWVLIGRTEAPAVRQAREAAHRELPHVVGLLADALRAGQAPGAALTLVCEALPGPATDRLDGAVGRLRLGVDPETVWAELSQDPALAPLGRALGRSHSTGGSVLLTVERLAESLAEDRRGEVEDRARSVGVKAAVPLGLCLLPSFVLLGIVPVVAGMLGTLGL